MRALSLTRPWPYAITHLGKRIENRSDKRGCVPAVCRYRGELYLHAAKSWDGTVGRTLLEAGLVDRLTAAILGDRTQPHPTGIVARCLAVGHLSPDGRAWLDPGGHEEDPELLSGLDLRWWHGGYALALADVVPLDEPVPCKGALGVWTVPAWVARHVRAVEEGIKPEDLRTEWGDVGHGP